MIKLTIFFVPALIILAIVSAIVKKKNAYSAFIQGSKEGLNLFKEVFPSVIAMLLAVTLLDSCGLLDDLALLLERTFPQIKMIKDIVPMLIFRPISGSASLAVLQNVCTKGPDLYFSTVGITSWRHALKSGLIADAVGMLTAIILALIFLK